MTAEDARSILAQVELIFWAAAAGVTSASPLRLHGYAMDVADFAATAHLQGIPGNWEAVYDTWLARATQHEVQAQALGRD